MYTITTLNGSHTGTLIECPEWQCEHQGGMPDINGADISDIRVSHACDPYRDDVADLAPEQAEQVVRERLADEL